MKPLKVSIKKLVDHAFLPQRGSLDAAGFDLVAIDLYKNHDYKFVEYGTGLSVEIPKGYVGLIFPRSSISKTPHTLANSVGVIDSDYRGEIKLRMRYDENREDMEYGFGDRVGQLIIIPYPQVEFEVVQELSNTERGDGGFGSTGS
jgi:dUTP pyrophosphatase